MKTRVTLSLDRRLLEQVDRAAKHGVRYRSRSAVIEDAVKAWANRAYEASIRDYYLERPETDRLQDDAWADFAGRELSAVVDPGQRPRQGAKARRKRS